MKYQHLSVEERDLIQYLWWDKKSIRSIAKALDRSPSSIGRELRRNFHPTCKRYVSHAAHERALQKRQSRGRHDRLKNQGIRAYVIRHLKEGWSPEQISGRIKIDLSQTISHEAIYQYVYAQVYRQGWGFPKPGALDLRPCLRRRRRHRLLKGMRNCHRLPRHSGPSIDDRPAIVDQRGRLGDWEGDTVESTIHKPGINTLVERKTGLLLITKLNAKDQAATIEAIRKRLGRLPARARQTLTLDNGRENINWQRIEKEAKVKYYYAHPYHSWERGTNENTNGLVREYFPKKTDFTIIPAEAIAQVERKLNTRPRKRLNYLTPLEAFSVALED